MFEALLFGEVTAATGTSPCYTVLLQRDPFHFDRESLRTPLQGMSAGDCIAYAIALNASSIARLVTFAMLPLRLRRIERTLTHAGAQVVGRYGVDPSLDAPSCIYEL